MNSNMNSSKNNNSWDSQEHEEKQKDLSFDLSHTVSRLRASSILSETSFYDTPTTSYSNHQFPLSETIRMWQMQVLFLCYMVAVGTGLMVIYNIESIASSLGKSPSSFFVTLISLANGLGRISSGIVIDKITKHVTKLQAYSASMAVMGLAQLVLSFGFSSSFILFPMLLMVGYLFGVNTVMNAISVVDLFGERYVATNYGFVDTAPIFGSYLFATFAVDIFYDQTKNDDGGSDCYGASCFRGAFLLNVVCCAFASYGLYRVHLDRERTDIRGQYEAITSGDGGDGCDDDGDKSCGSDDENDVGGDSMERDGNPLHNIGV